MSFLHFWPIYAGIAAVVIPIAVHFLTRPRPTRYPISTLRFVREALRQNQARQRLRDWLVLALRVAAILLIAFALARPLIGRQALVTEDSDAALSRIVVLDASASMGAEDHGIARFERARSRAAMYLQPHSGLRANLIQAVARPRAVFDTPSANLPALHDELKRAKVRPERLNVAATLAAAAEMFAKAPATQQPVRELIIISDFQRSNWATADFSVLPEDTRIQLVSAAAQSDAPLGNLAILRAGVRGRPIRGGEAQLEVEVANYSRAPRSVNVEVSLGPSVYRLNGECATWNETTLRQTITIGADGWLSGEARLTDPHDALSSDNVRPFVVHVREAPVYALISRQPKGSAFYLERAMAPFAGRSGNTASKSSVARTFRLDPSRIDADTLASAELIVIDHPGKLSADTIRLMASLVRRGRGLLYVAADAVDAVNLKQLSDALGSSLQMPVEFMPAEVGSPRRNLVISEVRRDQPPFDVYGDNLNQVLSVLRFSGGLASRRLNSGLAEDILASYNDRSAALVLTSCGAGTLAVLNADLGDSNLGSPGADAAKVLPVLVYELVERMARHSGQTGPIYCGEPAVLALPPEAGAGAGLKIVGPAGADENQLGQLIDDPEGGIDWRLSGDATAGVYQVLRDGVPVYAVAIELPPDESDLRAIDRELFSGRLSGGRSVHFEKSQSDQDRRDDTWPWLAAACVLCMLGEIAALRLFRT